MFYHTTCGRRWSKSWPLGCLCPVSSVVALVTHSGLCSLSDACVTHQWMGHKKGPTQLLHHRGCHTWCFNRQFTANAGWALWLLAWMRQPL